MNPVLIDVPDRIETPHLILRAPLEADAAAINASILDSINELKVWMPWATPTPTLDDTRVYTARSIARHVLREEVSYRLIDKESRQHAGNLSLFNIDWTVRRFEVGYWLRTGYCGRGYMTEAVRALSQFAFERLQARRLEIRADVRNQRSCSVAERSGFVLDGTLRCDSLDTCGEPRDTRVYSRTFRDLAAR